MKIGILSMQRVRNYGSFLQAYALKRLLEQQGHSVRFVDLPLRQTAQAAPSKGMFAKLRLVDRYVLRRLDFQKKRHQLHQVYARVQETYLGLGEMQFSAEGCDAVVIGSDEVFNCDSGGDWKITPERFGYDPTVKKSITYAASCGYAGVGDINDADAAIIKKGLSCLDAVSVRDENTAGFVRHFRQGEILYHLDPVLIYDFREELRTELTHRPPSEPYLVVYAYHNRIKAKEEILAIRSYAKKHGLKLISVGGLQAWCDDYAVLEPFEVLDWFRGAACIVTDTFHGTVMSAKFNKPFAVIVRESNANKLQDLLVRLDLQEHQVREMTRLPVILDRAPTYESFNQTLALERQRTEEYLKNALMM
ncbi:MAG: polysaccharide pyruvyl transferase family protein [Oscillospiraceae bacterium]|nr:polysaccharide pyruvyl transferase family protein [Oscillospiraceae bacterium]